MSEYDAVGTISQKEVEDLRETVEELKVEVERWLKEHYPELCRPG